MEWTDESGGEREGKRWGGESRADGGEKEGREAELKERGEGELLNELRHPPSFLRSLAPDVDS